MGSDAAWPELEKIYAELDQELAALNPLCSRSGRCCRFREFGHQLWTTDLELDYLVAREGLRPAGDGAACPYLRDGLCGVRDHRMLGCRIYFCDPAYASAMGPLYEKYHGKIKELQKRHAVPYRYSELIQALESRNLKPEGGGPR